MSSEIDPSHRYRISDVAAAVGVSPQTLRVWEQNGLLTPTRTLGGQRLYTRDDVERARQVAKLRNRHGVSPQALSTVAAPGSAALGSRIREVRKQRAMTQRELAERADLSRSHMAAVERGDAPLTFAVLSRLAEILEVPTRELGPAGSTEDLVVRDGEGSRTDLAGVTWEELAGPGHDLEPALLLVPPGTASGDVPTARPGTTFVYVLDGVLHFELRGRPYARLTRGDAITLPSGVAWLWVNRSEQDARALYVETVKPRRPILEPFEESAGRAHD